MSKRLLIATTNRGKLREFEDLTNGSEIEFCTPADVGLDIDVKETGATFAENAAIKAAEYARRSGLVALADDSGLVIDALDGRPGVLSARYGGPDLDFAQRIELVLNEMDGATIRSARFICSIAVADTDGGIIATAEGTCEGSIAYRASGDGGFGYDPIFLPVDHDLTFADLASEVKNSVSHRREAICKIIPFLRDFIAV